MKRKSDNSQMKNKKSDAVKNETFSVQNPKQYNNSVTIEKRKNKFSSRNLIINIFCIFISIVMIALLILILYYFIVTKQKYDLSSILTILKSWH